MNILDPITTKETVSKIPTPTVTITGKTFVVTSESWKKEFVRTKKPSPGPEVSNEIAASNFQLILDKEFEDLNSGDVGKHFVMGKYTDAGYFTSKTKLDLTPETSF